MHYLRSRYYKSDSSRFLNADSLLPNRAFGINLYQYARNSPNNRYDPNGTVDFDSMNDSEKGAYCARIADQIFGQGIYSQSGNYIFTGYEYGEITPTEEQQHNLATDAFVAGYWATLQYTATYGFESAAAVVCPYITPLLKNPTFTGISTVTTTVAAVPLQAQLSEPFKIAAGKYVAIKFTHDMSWSQSMNYEMRLYENGYAELRNQFIDVMAYAFALSGYSTGTDSEWRKVAESEHEFEIPFE